jgi:hypothetical protein
MENELTQVCHETLGDFKASIFACNLNAAAACNTVRKEMFILIYFETFSTHTQQMSTAFPCKQNLIGLLKLEKSFPWEIKKNANIYFL